jgi:hypothetical protein
MNRCFCSFFLLLFIGAGHSALAQLSKTRPDPNETILEMVRKMPLQGGYSAAESTNDIMMKAVRVEGNQLQIDPSLARPNHCAEATYIVFLEALRQLIPATTVSPLASALAAHHEKDGTGVWGRWNANGPGTASLFYQLGLGRNFTSWNEARQGDFMKIFWQEQVGKNEHGHSAIYLGQSRDPQTGEQQVRFWSSNESTRGFGFRTVPKSKIKAVIFSRLERPAAILKATELSPVDPYLASLQSVDSSLSEALAYSGIKAN